jgi:hypothetical protein
MFGGTTKQPLEFPQATEWYIRNLEWEQHRKFLIRAAQTGGLGGRNKVGNRSR